MSEADTIVALATPAGVGERAVLRLSGPQAWQVLQAALEELPELRAGRLLRAALPLGAGARLDVELMLWAAPRSATGEQLAEIHLPAWPAAVAECTRLLRAAGCRPAERGEFTRRAVLLGKLDVERAVALGALSRAADAPSAQAALDTLIDGADRALDALREQLLATLALLEAHVDHEDDDTEALAHEELPRALAALSARAAQLADRSASRASAEGELDVLLLGPPNAGKSSLMLALCPDARTTASPVPGTTRDALHARRRVGERTLRFIDGPGVSWEHAWSDPLDARAMQQFLEQLPEHALVLDLEDACAPSSHAERAQRRAAAGSRPRLDVASKADLLDASHEPVSGAERDASGRVVGAVAAATGGASEQGGGARFLVSATTGFGLENLLDALLALAPPPAPLSARHALEAELLADVLPLLTGADLAADLAADLDLHADPTGQAKPRSSLGAASPEHHAALLRSGALPLVALALREAAERLDAHSQRSADLSEELLDRVFAGFCLGK
ncbi:MAG: hypothetical protein DHS20C15_07510 [Planctomycetota bacterium]|nr:MAG: hypothetical protein DHS20C15_07510 [Planctomycetota bacterium]